MVHLGKFAVGGAGIVMAEATAITPEGRISPWDLGLYEDRHAEALKPVAAFISARGAVPAIQLAHAGYKASGRKGTEGGAPLDATDAARGFPPWRTIAPSAHSVGDWPTPREMTGADIVRIVEAWAAAARRAIAAGFRIIEIHGAHGYLIHEFLSPASNRRGDGYGGSRKGRMRLAIEVAESVRAAIPDETPLFFRVSAVDSAEGDGWRIEDSVALAAELKRVGVDVIDCSSGGMLSLPPTRAAPRHFGFQVPYADAIRSGAGIATVAVGLIVTPQQAERILADGSADIIGIGREALTNPHWALHAHRVLGGSFEHWPDEYRVWLERREEILAPLDRAEVDFPEL